MNFHTLSTLGTTLPIHRHRISGVIQAVQVPMGQYHTLVCLEDGSVIFEAKDWAYDPERTEDFLRK